MSDIKRCADCGAPELALRFNPFTGEKTKRDSVCPDCRRLRNRNYQRAWRAKNTMATVSNVAAFNRGEC
jgi:ssDNA-binding Zn-finger/Zn-ribbon topoisomerase 1